MDSRGKLRTLARQLEKEASVNKDTLEIQRDTLKEAHHVRRLLDDELKVKIETNKTLKKKYARNIHHLVKLLMTCSNVREYPCLSGKMYYAFHHSCKIHFQKNMSYSNMQVGAIAIGSIESFLLSDMFADFLSSENFPDELSACALFREQPYLTNSYTNHLNKLKDIKTEHRDLYEK